MIGLYIFLGIVLFITLIMILPIHISVIANSDDLVKKPDLIVYLRILFVKINIIPSKPKKEKKKKTKKVAKNKKGEPKKENKPTKKQDIIELLNLIYDLICSLASSLKKHLHVKVKKYQITVGTDDAAKTALIYGAVDNISGNIFNYLSENLNFKTKDKDIYVKCDFQNDKITYNINLDFSLLVFGGLATGLKAAMQFVKNRK